MTQGTNSCTALPAAHRRGVLEDVAEALAPRATYIAGPRSVHPTAYSALQAYPGLQSSLLVSATLVHGYGEVGNHLKAQKRGKTKTGNQSDTGARARTHVHDTLVAIPYPA